MISDSDGSWSGRSFRVRRFASPSRHATVDMVEPSLVCSNENNDAPLDERESDKRIVACVAEPGFEAWSHRCIVKLVSSHQTGIASRCRCIERDGLLGGKTNKIVRAAGLGSGSREAGPSEGLNPDDGTDHIAVDVDVTDGKAIRQ